MQKSDCLNIDVEAGVYQLLGKFDKFSIPHQWKVIEGTFKEVTPKIIDLNGILDCDSALIALLVEIKRHYPEIEVMNTPENLIQLLDLYQVKSLLF